MATSKRSTYTWNRIFHKLLALNIIVMKKIVLISVIIILLSFLAGVAFKYFHKTISIEDDLFRVHYENLDSIKNVVRTNKNDDAYQRYLIVSLHQSKYNYIEGVAYSIFASNRIDDAEASYNVYSQLILWDKSRNLDSLDFDSRKLATYYLNKSNHQKNLETEVTP